MRKNNRPAFGDQVVLPGEGVRSRMPEDLAGDGPDLTGRLLDIDDITTPEVQRLERGSP